MKYKIRGEDGWEIVAGSVTIAKITGAGSLAVALAACEKLNGDFSFNGWTVRVQDYMEKKIVPEQGGRKGNNT